jgi:RNA polymerase sigma factor (TIGR02999 family)
MSEMTELIRRAGDGDGPARHELYTLLYRDLCRMARARLRRSEPVTLLNTTSLVHEAYLRFFDSHALVDADRGRFFAFAASVMRSVVVDAVRSRHGERRGGAAEHVDLDTNVADAVATDDGEIIRVHEALDELAAIEPRLAHVVEMRYFAGLTEADIAGALGVTERTVRRDWNKARTLLFAALR